MAIRKIIAAGLLLTTLACNYSNQDQIVTYDTIPSTEDLVGPHVSYPVMTFAGTLPCADCGGIVTELTLVPDSLVYRLKETYLNTGGGDKLFESTGIFAINKGGQFDSTAFIYQLNPGDTERTRAFRSESDTIIVMLDRNMNEIKSTLSYKLTRVADTLQ